MFQQNRYQLGRYHSWLKETIVVKRVWILKIIIICLPIIGINFIMNTTTAFHMYCLLIILYAYSIRRWDHQHVYIQKINFTYRIRRLYLLYISFYTIGITLFYFCFSFQLLVLITPILFFTPWLILCIIATLLQPVEQAIRNHYAHEAKQILIQRDQLRKVGITGSYGKTSIKNILYALLSQDYYTLMTPHSYNNLMGLTISIQTLLKPLHEVFIAEMGADHVGEIKQLMEFIQPQIGIVCAIGPQHIKTFGTQDAIINEKMEMIEQLPINGIGILNYDNTFIRSYKICNTCTIITYGIHEEDVDYRAIQITYSPQGTTFLVMHKEQSFEVSTRLLGEHNVLNILAAICVAKAYHVSNENIKKAIQQLPYIEHRLEVKKMKGYTLLDDAYNSNPEGAKYALDVLSQMPGKRILITPGFLDLGKLKTSAHQAYAKQMCNHVDIVILIGITQTRDIYDELLTIGFNTEAIYCKQTIKDGFALLHQLIEDGDTVLIENDLPDAFNH